MHKELPVSFRAEYRRRNESDYIETGLKCRVPDLAQDRPVFRRVRYDSAASHLALADLELGLYQRDAFSAFRCHSSDGGEDPAERDEGNIDRGQVEEHGKVCRVEGASVNALHHDYSRILPDLPCQLIVTDVDRPYPSRAVLKQAIREAAGRCAHVDARLAPNLYLELAKRGLEFEAASPDIGECFAFDSNLGACIDEAAGLIYALVGDENLAREDHCLSARARISESGFNEEYVETLFGHPVTDGNAGKKLLQPFSGGAV